MRDWTINTQIDVRELAQFNATLAEMTVAERTSAARITVQRAEIIVAGGLILEGIMRALGIEALTTCEWALREGVIIDRLRDWDFSRKDAKTQSIV